MQQKVIYLLLTIRSEIMHVHFNSFFLSHHELQYTLVLPFAVENVHLVQILFSRKIHIATETSPQNVVTFQEICPLTTSRTIAAKAFMSLLGKPIMGQYLSVNVQKLL